MSRSNPKLENPCKKFIDFKADKGQFFFYDKEFEQQIEVPIPIYFVVLDELSTISGYNKKNDCGIYSNEVHRTSDEILRVKTFKGGESITGLYTDVRDSIIALGGKFTKSVYVMLINSNKSTEMANFKFKGASFSAWLDKKVNTDNSIVGVTKFIEEHNGSTTYQVPVFEAFKLTPELNAKALEMDVILQKYLKEYKAQQPEKEIVKAEVEISKEPFPASQEFQNIKSAKEVALAKSNTTPDELSDLPF
jgi:hypothetical protein